VIAAIPMTHSPIRCPKCSHEQTNPTECEACGLLFHKYAQARERAKEISGKTDEPTAPPQRSSPTKGRIAAVVVLMTLTAALTYVLTTTRGPVPAPPLVQPATPAVEKPAAVEATPPAAPSIPTSQSSSSSSAIERTKNGTVAIETPWGKGSGFFITDTTIVTNRHVIEPERSQLEELRHKVNTGRELLTLEQEKINTLRNRLNQMADSPTRRQLIIVLQEKEKQLAQLLPLQQDAEARLKEMEKPRSTSDIKIFLADGSEYTAQSSQISAKRDLALLSVYSAKAVVLKAAAKNQTLQQGDKVYTIGNPVGLRNTVTSGIFSGYRQHKDTGEVMLQTDAPINPGNSGGPLIDEHGQVHGVNTLIIQNTQGIGFAIPIQAVFEEFSLNPR
jgi:serine protease Do